MAVVQNTLIGRAKRSIGGVTFMTWKGKNVAKSKPVSVANPQTPLQIMRRSALSQLVAIFRLVPGAVDLGFAKQAIGMSAYNAFVGANAKVAFNFSAPPVATLIPANLIFSKGSMQVTPSTGASADVSVGNIDVEFDGTVIGVGQSASDLWTMVARNRTTGVWFASIETGLRSSSAAIVTIDQLPYASGNVIDTWFWFTSATTGISSDSVYNTMTATA
jgi:Family of unknown function (DUF6266)